MSINLNGHEQPVDKMAAMSYSKGVTFEKERHVKAPTIFDIQPKIKPFPGFKKDDLTGLKYSQLTVIGYYGRKKECCGGQALWVIKCVCGRYFLRATKIIKRRTEGHLYQCDKCVQIAQMLRKYNYFKKVEVLSLVRKP